MTTRVLATLLVVVVLVGVVVAGYVMSRRRAKDVVPGAPDRMSGEVVSGLMTELRKSQAEAAYWKSAAQRLQREADER
ncbi:MAG TPA: hypothetical protein VHV79_08765 [Mycobacteriales bacterium]|jgi:hypothetical protein|nr:hypothetical protein [Mycobacteriales bacterium]